MPQSNGESIGFELSVSGRDDGTIEAAYLRLGRGKVSRTREVIEDVLLADYDARGRLLGIEILAPVKIARLSALIDAPRRRSFRRFLARSAPSDFLLN